MSFKLTNRKREERRIGQLKNIPSQQKKAAATRTQRDSLEIHNLKDGRLVNNTNEVIMQGSTFNELVSLTSQLLNAKLYNFAFKYSTRLLSENPNYTPLVIIALKSCNKLSKFHEIVIISSQYLAEFSIFRKKQAINVQLFRANAYIYLKHLDKAENDLKEIIERSNIDSSYLESAKKLLRKVYERKIDELVE
ncbi:hypothetical protein DID76_04275 [Candidatus Marinamargulisbacteria bacterium SCGC AG-414-C22]|nr:hypothetical protein DID76_04275 [Candidatus Marinamargulisbacteria bacterium SCGC AG-414-C22]